MSKRRRTIAATDLRVHLGEALKALDEEDIVIEKGGIPVAMLTKYGDAREMSPLRSTEYEMALGKRAEPGTWPEAEAAMASGWAGIEAAELVAEVYRGREAGATERHYELESFSYEREVSGRQRRMHPGPGKTKRVAEKPAPKYRT